MRGSVAVQLAGGSGTIPQADAHYVPEPRQPTSCLLGCSLLVGCSGQNACKITQRWVHMSPFVGFCSTCFICKGDPKIPKWRCSLSSSQCLPGHQNPLSVGDTGVSLAKRETNKVPFFGNLFLFSKTSHLFFFWGGFVQNNDGPLKWSGRKGTLPVNELKGRRTWISGADRLMFIFQAKIIGHYVP